MIENINNVTIDKQQLGWIKKKIPKKVYDLALQTETFQLNQNSFNMRQCYYQDYLLNGTQLIVVQAKGTRELNNNIVMLLDNGNIMFYSGVNLMQYNPSNKIYKVFKEVRNILRINQFCQRFSGKSFICILSLKNNNIPYLQILDQYTKEMIYQETLAYFNGWKILDVLMYFGKRKYFWLICQRNQQKKIVIHLLEQEQLRIQQKTDRKYKWLHYNYDINVYLFAHDKQVYSLRFIMLENKFQQKLIFQAQNQIICCTSFDNIIASMNCKALELYNYIQKRKISNFTYQDLLKQYYDENAQVTYMEFKQNKLLISYSIVSVITCITIQDQRIKISTITFRSPTFHKFIKIMMDNQANAVFTISSHSQAIDQSEQEISLGTPIITKQPTQKQFLRINQIFLNILNTNYGMKGYRWERLQYLNIMIAPWKSDYFLQTNNKIITKDWVYPIDQGICSAIHPTGLYLTIGFRDSFRVYTVISQGLIYSNLSDSVRDCKSICYSMQGDHLAVASISNIFIYNSYTCKKLYTIVHSQSSFIKKITYKNDQLECMTKHSNYYIYSISNNYAKMLSFHAKQFLLSHQKQTNFQVIQYDPKYDVFVACWNNQIKFFTNRGTTEYCSHKLPHKITCVQICSRLRLMFIGNQNGQLMTFNWPNNPNRIQDKHPQKNLHQSAVIMIRVTNDLMHVISISSKGSMFISRLRTIDRLREVQRNEIEYQHRNFIYMNDILKSKRLTFHSYHCNHLMAQKIKQLQEEIINENFMRPEEEEKDNRLFHSKLEQEKSKLIQRNQRLLRKINSVHLEQRDRVHKCKFELERAEQQHKRNMNNLYQRNREELQRIILKKNELQKEFLKIKMEKESEYNQRKMELQGETYNMNKELKKQLNNLENRAVRKQKDFEKLSKEITISTNQQQRERAEERIYWIKPYQKEIEEENKISVQMAIANGKIQKQIKILNARVQQLKQSTQQLERIIKKLNNEAYIQQYKNFQKKSQNYNQKMLQIESEYIDNTKTILKNTNRVQFVMQTFEKRKKEIIQLDEYLIQTNKNIDDVLKSILLQKQHKYENSLKINQSQMLLKQYKQKIEKLRIQVIQSRASLKDTKYKIYAQFSKRDLPIADRDVIVKRAAQHSVKSLQSKQFKIGKAIKAYEKIKHTISNEKIYYANNRSKAFEQNQDLIEQLNSLTHENKYLKQFNKEPDFKKKSNQTMTNLNQTTRKIVTPFIKYHQQSRLKKTRKLIRVATEPNELKLNKMNIGQISVNNKSKIIFNNTRRDS